MVNLQDVLDQVEATLEDAYKPEASREDLAAAVGEALATIAPDAVEDDVEESNDEED
jgi:hypothetical protein